MSFLASMLTGGSLGAGYSNQSTNTNSNTTSNQNATGDSSSSRILTPEQQALQDPLFSMIQNLLKNPQTVTAPFQQQARNDVNNDYSGLADSLREQFMGSGGGGSSGKYGLALAGGNLRRLGDLANVDSQFAQTNARMPLDISSLATNLLGMNFGQKSNFDTSQTGSSNTNSKSNTSGFSFKI